MKKESILKTFTMFALAAIVALTVGACSSGGGGAEEKYQSHFTKVNPKWKVYEVKQEADNTIIRVEADDGIS